MAKKRVAAIILATILVIVMLSSSLFIIEHADHDCIGENCSVCELLYICAQNLKNLSVTLFMAAVIAAFAFSLCGGTERFASASAPRTLVLLKVKLSN